MYKNLSKIINKNIFYNLLALSNIIIGFLFTVIVGKIFGLGKETDIYFSSLIIIGFIGSFIKGLWEAFSPDYIKFRISQKNISDEIYSILLNNIVFLSLTIIGLFYIISPYIFFIEKLTLSYLNIFIFYLLVHNVLYYNKALLNLEHYYATFYLVDLFIYIILSLTVYYIHNITLNDIAIILITLTFISVLYQFYIIFFKLKFKYVLKFYNKDYILIYKNSIKYKIGTMIYSVKDLIIVSFFTAFGTGYYSLYSYANKFAMTVAQIVNAPIVNIFTTKLNYLVGEKKYHEIKILIKNVLIQTVPLFTLSSIVLYFSLPFIIETFFGKTINLNNITEMQMIFLYLLIFNIIIVIETPFAKVIFVFKLFNYSIVINIVFISLFLSGYFLIKHFELSYIYLLIILIISQFTNFLLYYKKYISYKF